MSFLGLTIRVLKNASVSAGEATNVIVTSGIPIKFTVTVPYPSRLPKKFLSTETCLTPTKTSLCCCVLKKPLWNSAFLPRMVMYSYLSKNMCNHSQATPPAVKRRAMSGIAECSLTARKIPTIKGNMISRSFGASTACHADFLIVNSRTGAAVSD